MKVSPQKSGDFGSPVRSPRVIFPRIGGYITQDERSGPVVSDVHDTADPDYDNRNEEELRDDGAQDQLQSNAIDTDVTGIDDPVLRVAFRPPTPQHAWTVPPLAPQRPRSVGARSSAQQSSSGARFRARALTSAVDFHDSNKAAVPRPTSPSGDKSIEMPDANMKDAAVQASLPKKMRHISDLFSSEESPPDPVLMQQLWQEYSERAARSIDKQEYHRKMQHKYNERKVLRDHVAELERQLAAANQDREEILRRFDAPENGISIKTYNTSSPSQSPIRSPSPSPRAFAIPPAVDYDYRQRNVLLEQALSDSKQHLEDTEELLIHQQSKMMYEIDALKASLKLEQYTNETLARRLREAEVSLQNTSDELVDTRTDFERESIAHHNTTQLAEHDCRSLEAQHRQQLVVHNAQQALTNLGRQGLNEKVKVFHSRSVVAEQRMRAALEQVTLLQQHVDDQQRELEHIYSSQDFTNDTFKNPTDRPYDGSKLTSMTGVVIFQDFVNISGCKLLLRAIFDDSIEDSTTEHSFEHFSIRFVAYDPLSNQYDCLTFTTEDIRRLVIGYQKYLKCGQTPERHECNDLAVQLLKYVHAGFKKGQLVLCEIPSPSSLDISSSCANLISLAESRYIPIYKGTQILECCVRNPAATSQRLLDPAVAEVIIIEVTDPDNNNLWWLEICCTILNEDDSGIMHEAVARVTCNELTVMCDRLGSYRLSEHSSTLKDDKYQEHFELMVIHEEILEPLLERLCIYQEEDCSYSLEILNEHNGELPTRCSGLDVTKDLSNERSVPPCEVTVRESPRTLDYRGIVYMGGIYYCARFREIWDDEIMLEIVLEDSEAFTRLSGTLDKYQLKVIIDYLSKTDTKCVCVPMLDKGIPVDFQAPICKLLAQHLKKSHVGCADTPPGIVLDTLLAKLVAKHLDEQACNNRTSFTVSNHVQTAMDRSIPTIHGDKQLIIEKHRCHDRLSEQRLRELVDQIENPAVNLLIQKRQGARIRTHNGHRELALVRIFHGFLDFEGVVAVIFPLQPQSTSVRRVLVCGEPLETLNLMEID